MGRLTKVVRRRAASGAPQQGCSSGAHRPAPGLLLILSLTWGCGSAGQRRQQREDEKQVARAPCSAAAGWGTGHDRDRSTCWSGVIEQERGAGPRRNVTPFREVARARKPFRGRRRAGVVVIEGQSGQTDKADSAGSLLNPLSRFLPIPRSEGIRKLPLLGFSGSSGGF